MSASLEDLILGRHKQEPRPPVATVTPIDSAGGSRYATKALRSECENVAAAAEGTRNATLNKAAFNIAQLVAGGYLDDLAARDALRDAGLAAGLTSSEIDATIASGFRVGSTQPRVVADRPEAPTPTVLTLPEQAEAEGVDVEEYLRAKFAFIDWHELWATEDEGQEWIVEPLIPARRLIALYSAPKVGKSLLMLDVAVAICNGTECLGKALDRPRVVLYVDFENDPRGDVRTRLKAMGYGPGDLENLKYLSFPSLAKLDTPTGAQELVAAVRLAGAELVIIDTISRAVGGEENENDTWLNFYRHTGLALKQEGVACLRLDHTGKDHAKGMRGGSAKYGDVDAVWKMERVDDGETYKLECTDHRFALPADAERIIVHRDQDPRLTHRVSGMGKRAIKDANVEALVKTLEEADVPRGTGRDAAKKLLKPYGVSYGNDTWNEALKQHNMRVSYVPETLP